MPKRVDYKTQREFTGGLNLSRAMLQLEADETPDVLNVDLDPRGGFGLRRGVAPYGAAVPEATANAFPNSLFAFPRSNTATTLILTKVGSTVYYYNGGAWTALTAPLSIGVTATNSLVFNDKFYMTSFNNAVLKWDGVAAGFTAMIDPAILPSWSESIGTVTNDRFPKAKLLAAYQGAAFCANIIENATAYPNRVRWSHPLFPEDWRSLDYIDIEPDDGDQITALVPLDDRLLVFKHNSVHAIYGSPPESFAVSPISRNMGAPTQQAVCAGDGGVFFWHEESGAHYLSGNKSGSKWVFERLYQSVEDGRINTGAMGKVTVGWINRRLWCAVPWETATKSNRVFVYDPYCGKDGAWTFYDLKLGPFCSVPRFNDPPLVLAGSTKSKYVLQLDVFDLYTDSYSTGVTTPISSRYMTRWWDLGEPAVQKRWKRPEFVVLSGQTSEVLVDVYRDYDPTESAKSFNINTYAPATAGVWAEPNDPNASLESYWNDPTALWGVDGVFESSNPKDEHLRGSPLGNARAVALRFQGSPTVTNRWRVDALTMKWVSKRVRN